MIVSWLTGGLGNQMFQYAAGLALARTRHTELKLDRSWYDETTARKSHESYALDAFSVPERFATPGEIEQTRGSRPIWHRRWRNNLQRLLRPGHPPAPGNWHAPPSFAFYPAFFEQPDNTYLHGMFQSERFFAPVAGDVRARFSRPGPGPAALAPLAGRIKSGPSAFLHFRRGDYVTDPRYARDIGQPAASYYDAAVRRLRERHPAATLYIFSDDIDAVARDFKPPGPHEFVREPAGTAPHEVLHLMSLCDHAIIANSTFSWWGAWLGEKPGQFVIAPRRWFAAGSPHDGRDVVPDRWTKL